MAQTLSIRIPVSLHVALKVMAKSEGVSLNKLVKAMLVVPLAVALAPK